MASHFIRKLYATCIYRMNIIFTGDELFSDAHKYELIEDEFFIKADGKVCSYFYNDTLFKGLFILSKYA